jgi:hypothetical protein
MLREAEPQQGFKGFGIDSTKQGIFVTEEVTGPCANDRVGTLSDG